jgi:starch synthase
MKKRIAIVRGPNLNSWEMQNFTPLMSYFEIVGFTSYSHNFDISSIPFEVQKLFSVGQSIRARILRASLDRLIGDYHDLQGLERALNGFELVHSAETSYYCTYQAARAKHRARFKLVVTIWENIPFLHNLPATQRIKAEVFRATDLFLAASNRAREALILEGVPEEKIKVQMPGVDIKHFHPMEKDSELLRRFGCSEDDFIVLFVANLYREKGVFDLLYAFRRLLDRLGGEANVKLLIAGKGREEAKIRKTIHQLRLNNSAELIGSFQYSVMPRIHNLADLFVLPSIPISTWQEQFGYVLVESMACGKPVISTRSGSIPEIVSEAGILVPPNDFSSLAEALHDLLTNERKRKELGLRARSYAEEIFDAHQVAMQYMSHYARLT